MSGSIHNVTIGQRVVHPELGEGIVLTAPQNGYISIFFRTMGERQVPLESLRAASTPEMEMIRHVMPASPEALQQLWLAIEAEQLPLIANAVTLTAAKIDLLPHQIVLTHRIVEASPRRFLIADEVGLGKTIEAALILRELASRGQLKRVLLIVPAGLVENWRREINETFHLDFEVFGAEGDVIDRKSNAFAKHDRLIASLDTLKRPTRIARLLDAPAYDLIVFDEAHHLTVTRSGRKVSKTENYKLAEALRDHTRDLLLLSATPHQGDHFRFWMLIRLLDPGLFTNEEDMLANRHRLNAVVIRRTKSDVCARDGSPLFARRQVHTHCFTLTHEESMFYTALCLYLVDGYNLAQKQDNSNQALGFVMTTFQKLAASSFAAVRMTLEKRLLMLTILETILCEQSFDVEGRDNALRETRQMIQQMHGLSEDSYDQAQVDRIMADARLQVLKRLKHDQEKASNNEEIVSENEEDLASTYITFTLPEERKRILDLLVLIPVGEESKARELVRGLRTIFNVNPREKIVIFTTYLGSVNVLQRTISSAFPTIGIEVLKGGDHGAKLAAERRFRRSLGPQILICTAAGREGINLQFAHILFNADLPWNPMELEQRIGRIHRYGQKYTSQVYNLVASDTIEGQIFLLLEQKVNDIAATLSKVDEKGNLAEDLRSQILGQLSEQLSYERLYQEALQDPTLLRTRLELEVAMQNVEIARHAVLELFQDLESFRLDDYNDVDDAGQSIERLRQFIALAVHAQGGELRQLAEELFLLSLPGQPSILLTTNRDNVVTDEEIELIGLEQPQVAKLLHHWANVPLQERALAAKSVQATMLPGVLTIWLVGIQGDRSVRYEQIIWLGVSTQDERSPQIESIAHNLRDLEASVSTLDAVVRARLLRDVIPQALQRELIHSGTLIASASYASKLIGWIEILA